MPEDETERSQPIEQGAEKKALSSPDANAARNASGSEVREVQSTNPNRFESMTKLPTVKEGQSLADAEAEYKSFGIQMSDGTAVTSACIEAPAKKKVSVDPRPSFVEGLKAVGNDEEAQGRFSIEYMERKGKEALAALQKPAGEQVLIASNITPAAPNLEQLQKYPEIVSDSHEEKVPKVAQNVEYDGRPLTLTSVPDGQTIETLRGAGIEIAIQAFKYGFEHPYRGRELSYIAAIPSESFSLAYGAFPEIKNVGKLIEKDATQLMKAIIANELDYYNWKDSLSDSLATTAHGHGFGRTTIGHSQISLEGVKSLASDFQKEVDRGKRTSNPLNKYLKMNNEQILERLSNQKELPLLIAANLAHNVGMYSRNHYPINQQTLGYGFNPDLPPQKPREGHEMMPPQERLDQSEHARNVMLWLQKVRAAEIEK